MANTARDLIKCRISNDPGTTGSFTLAAAAANSLMPGAGDDGLKFKLNITQNGVGTEIRKDCTYTHSSTSFSRGTMVRSTGTADAALNFTSAAIVRVVPSAEDFLTTEQAAAVGVSVSAATALMASLVVGSSAAASANTTALQALATLLPTLDDNTIQIVFPDGDIYYNGVINWTMTSNMATPVTTVDEGSWPQFLSAGITTFIWTGAAVQGGTWKFSGAASLISTNLRFKNLRWSGPGVTVKSSTVATASVTTAATAVVLASTTGMVAGQALVIGQNARTSIYTTVRADPWWATIQSVVGTTVNFLPALPAGFTANVGNVVQAIDQTRAIEIGGQTSARQDAFFYVEFDRCGFIDWMSGIAGQDITTMVVGGQTVWNRCMFGLEGGYNQDTLEFNQPCMLCQVVSRTGAVTSGQRTITSLSNTDDLLPGMSMSDVTAPTTAQAFPAWAVIETVDSATQVTMTHASSVTGSGGTARTFQPVMGVMYAQGSGHSPWYPREVAPYDGVRSNGDMTRIIGPTLNHIRACYMTDSVTNSAIMVEDVYHELNQCLAVIGHAAGATSLGPYTFNRCILSGTSGLVSAPVETIGGGANVEFNGVNADTTLIFPLYQSASGSSQVTIKGRHNSVTTTAAGLFYPDTYFFNGITPPLSGEFCIDVMGSGPSFIVASVTASGATTNQEALGFDGINLTLSANTTLANQPYGSPTRGKRYRVTAVSTGAYTLTMGTNFLTQAGAAIGAIAVSSNAQVCVMDFVGTGTKWLLTGGTIAAGVPVFVTLS